MALFRHIKIVVKKFLSRSSIAQTIFSLLQCCTKLRQEDLALIEADVASVDLVNKEVITNNGNIPYDILVVALGATTNFFGTSGAADHAYVLKNLKDALNIRDRIIDIFERASMEKDEIKRKQMLSFVVVGGGATGVEIITEIAELCNETLEKYYRGKIDCGDVTISLINSGPELLSVFGAKTRAYALKILQKDNIRVLLNTQVKEVTKTDVLLGDSSRLATETVIWAAGVRPNQVSTVGGELQKDKGDRIMTDIAFRAIGHEDVFAVGDVAHVDPASERGLPMLAQIAVQQGDLLGKNIARSLSGKPLLNFSYHSKGEMVSLGRHKASGTVFGVHVYGRLAWFMWRTIYLFKFISNSKKFRIAFDWTMQLFSKRDISRAG